MKEEIAGEPNPRMKLMDQTEKMLSQLNYYVKRMKRQDCYTNQWIQGNVDWINDKITERNPHYVDTISNRIEEVWNQAIWLRGITISQKQDEPQPLRKIPLEMKNDPERTEKLCELIQKVYEWQKTTNSDEKEFPEKPKTERLTKIMTRLVLGWYELSENNLFRIIRQDQAWNMVIEKPVEWTGKYEDSHMDWVEKMNLLERIEPQFGATLHPEAMRKWSKETDPDSWQNKWFIETTWKSEKMWSCKFTTDSLHIMASKLEIPNRWYGVWLGIKAAQEEINRMEDNNNLWRVC